MNRHLRNENGTSTIVGIFTIVILGIIAAALVSAFIYLPQQLKAPYASITIESAKIINTSNGTIIQKVTLVHRMGETVNVSEINIITSINGEPLKNQLLGLPRTSAKGYNGIGGVLSGWSGDTTWNAGDTGTFNIATGTTGRKLRPGDKIVVKIIHVPSNLVITESVSSVVEEK